MKHKMFKSFFIFMASLLSMAVIVIPDCHPADPMTQKIAGMSLPGDGKNVSKQYILDKARLGIQFLKRQQKADGAIFQGPFSAFDIWESVNAALALAQWGSKIRDDLRPVVLKALKFVHRMASPNGLVIHGRYLKGAVCIETSAEYLRLLAAVFGPSDKSVRVTSATLRSLQQKNGIWSIQNPEIPREWQDFPSVTAFVLRSLSASETRPVYFEKSLGFLEHSQNEKGHWGVSPYYYGTPFYAMAPILEVVRHNAPQHGRMLARAKAYLIRSQRMDGSWYFKLNHVLGAASAELQTALALLSCANCGIGPGSKVFDKGIMWLLKKQRIDGSWDGGYFPYNDPGKRKKEDLYASALTLKVLYTYYTADSPYKASGTAFNPQ